MQRPCLLQYMSVTRLNAFVDFLCMTECYVLFRGCIFPCKCREEHIRISELQESLVSFVRSSRSLLLSELFTPLALSYMPFWTQGNCFNYLSLLNNVSSCSHPSNNWFVHHFNACYRSSSTTCNGGFANYEQPIKSER